MILNNHQDDDRDDVLVEMSDQHIVKNPDILRVGKYTNKRGKTWGFIEIEDEDGRSNRVWVDSDMLQDIITALVEIMPDVV